MYGKGGKKRKTFSSHEIFSADSHICEVYCYLYEPFIPHSLDLTVTSVYFSAQGVPTVLSNVVQVSSPQPTKIFSLNLLYMSKHGPEIYWPLSDFRTILAFNES